MKPCNSPVVQKDERHRKRRHYCLRCYGSLPDEALICPQCNFTNLPALRKRFWTQEPKLVELESELKILVILLCVGLCAGIFLSLGRTMVYGGWVTALPLFLGLALWQTVSKLTHIHPYFSAKWFWALPACWPSPRFSASIYGFPDGRSIRLAAIESPSAGSGDQKYFT